jgi:diguanylate cyclase (GGDEF)-like protein/PAS domain S-box-containing protein
MYRVLTCLGKQHDWRLVVLAGLVCFLASLAAISLVKRALATDGRARAIWVATAGAATGCGIWATHFIAMLAYDPGIAVAYDVGLTALSLIVAASVTAIGLGVAVYNPGRWSAPLGGGVVGAGVAGMHYLGMSALEVPGQIQWSPDLVVVSILLGMVLGAAALAVAVRRDNARSVFAAALLLTLAIVSHHFTAMGAVVIVPDPSRVIDTFALAPTSLALAVAGAAVAILGMSLIGAIADRRLADRTKEAAARLHSLAEATTEALAVCQDGLIVDVNSSFERLTGSTTKQLSGRSLQSLFHPVHAGIVLRAEASEIVVIGADGEMIECEASARAIPYRDGLRTVVSLRDLRERREAETRIRHLAHHDPLTDLPNRALFNEHLAIAVERAAAASGTFAILCVDLDRFKEVNDVFGHAVGDALLRDVSRRLKAAAEGAFVARLGGDEFTLIVAEGPQPASAEVLAARLQASLANDIEVDGQPLRVGLSIGIAIFPEDGVDAAALLNNGDAALYRAKAEGRGAIRFFEAAMDTRLRERRALQHELRSAIAHRELLLHYQPQALINGDIVGFEALVRWQHPTRGLFAPGLFIPIAEESGLIITLGEWILREACREAASWARPLQIAVNLSPVQFRHGDLPALVHATLIESGLAPDRLVLEITEGVLIGDFERALSILRRLKLLGVQIAMDDFGTGYSSLSYLQSFPFDKIKIDRTFISNLSRGPQSAAIIRAVIGLGRGLDLPVVAEGVETRDQHAFLRREECDEIQGFLVGYPLPMDDYAELVGRPASSKKGAASTGAIGRSA